MSKKIIDRTKGRRPKADEEFDVSITTKSGARYSYHGKTKKECRAKYRVAQSSVVKEEWEISKN